MRIKLITQMKNLLKGIKINLKENNLQNLLWTLSRKLKWWTWELLFVALNVALSCALYVSIFQIQWYASYTARVLFTFQIPSWERDILLAFVSIM
jgi:hypothetical protein